MIPPYESQQTFLPHQVICGSCSATTATFVCTSCHFHGICDECSNIDWKRGIIFPVCTDRTRCSMCIAREKQERMVKERQLISASVTNHSNLVVEALTNKLHWKLELLSATKGQLLKAYKLLKRPLNFQHKAPTENDAIAISLLQSHHDHMLQTQRNEMRFERLIHAQENNSTAEIPVAPEAMDDFSQRSLDALQNKNSQHKKWKDFLTSGGAGKSNTQIFALQDFLRQKSQHENLLTRALAEERLFIIDIICKRSYSRKQAHISDLPRRTNFVILQTLKRLGRDLKNLVPVDAQETAVFALFYDSIVHTASQDNNFAAICDPNMMLGTLSSADKYRTKTILGINTAPYKAARSYPDQSEAQSGGPVRGQKQQQRSDPYSNGNSSYNSNAGQRNNTAPATSTIPSNEIEKHKNRYHAILKSDTPAKVAELIHCNKNLGPVDRAFWKSYCKNCFWDCKLVQHSLKECREAANPCKITCPECKKAGKTEYHWLEACPIKNKTLR